MPPAEGPPPFPRLNDLPGGTARRRRLRLHQPRAQGRDRFRVGGKVKAEIAQAVIRFAEGKSREFGNLLQFLPQPRRAKGPDSLQNWVLLVTFEQ